MIMGATFAARWAPFYGKINVIGESVLNFDAYGVLGMGMLSLQSYYATGELDSTDTVVTNLEAAGKKVVITPNIGFGFNFFLNQTMALKLDARATSTLPTNLSTTRMSQSKPSDCTTTLSPQSVSASSSQR